MVEKVELIQGEKLNKKQMESLKDFLKFGEIDRNALASASDFEKRIKNTRMAGDLYFPNLIVATRGDKIIGYVQYDINPLSNKIKVSHWEIGWKERGKKIGLRLIAAAARDGKIAGVNNIVLSEPLSGSRRFREKHGFESESDSMIRSEIKVMNKYPNFFMKKGDLEKRKEYWIERFGEVDAQKEKSLKLRKMYREWNERDRKWRVKRKELTKEMEKRMIRK